MGLIYSMVSHLHVQAQLHGAAQWCSQNGGSVMCGPVFPGNEPLERLC